MIVHCDSGEKLLYLRGVVQKGPSGNIARGAMRRSLILLVVGVRQHAVLVVLRLATEGTRRPHECPETHAKKEGEEIKQVDVRFGGLEVAVVSC